MTTIDTTATGQATGDPDRAEVGLAVESRAEDPATARREAAAGADAVRETLTELGVPDDAVRTDGLDVREHRRRRHDEDVDLPRLYEATYSYLVELADVDEVGPVVDGAVDAGATRVDRVRFRLSAERRRDRRAAALRNAMGAARAEAEVLAACEGLGVVGVESVETRSVGGYAGGPVLHDQVDASGEAGATEVETGELTVSETVNVTFRAE